MINKQTARYLRYASGEILLVVIGILIALQIDNWNDDRKESATLESYLRSIARNVQSDIVQLKELRERRHENMLNISRVHSVRRKAGDYEIQDVFTFTRAVDLALQSLYFIPDSSAYEALKNSGVLDRLQGREIGQVISDYYTVLGKIQRLESEYNSSIKSLGTIFGGNAQEAVLPWAFFDPSALSPQAFRESQPYFRAVITGASVRELFNLQTGSSPKILLEYERAIAAGNRLIRMVVPGVDLPESRESSFYKRAGSAVMQGNPDLIVNGAVSFDTYWFGISSSDNEGEEFPTDFVAREDDALFLSYPGSPAVPGIESRAAIWLSVNDTAFGRAYRDFSHYDTLQLELRGGLGGERILVHMKDKDDPDDGSQTNVELLLTDQWQRYEIGLERFENANLSELSVVAGILFLQQHEPLSFWIRNARFTREEVD